jgi:GNAT superfamily N-acetyltransferase
MTARTLNSDATVQPTHGFRGHVTGDAGEAYPLADLSLARRLEAAEGRANAAFVEARARLEPRVGAAWTMVAGVYALFDGPDSPLTQTFGLGLFEPFADAEFDAVETFFDGHGADVHHEVCPMLPPDTLDALGRRGYRPSEHSSVMVRPTAGGAGDAGGTPAVTARLADSDEREIWARTAGLGWSSESMELAGFVEAFGRLIAGAPGVHCFLAEQDGTPIGAATLCLHGDVALLAGASTVPAARRQGAQRALLDARLRFASEHGAGLAMMVAQPGSGSQRNAERRGFRIAYTRTKWRRPAAGRGRPAPEPDHTDR